jgi:hypothetical protein
VRSPGAGALQPHRAVVLLAALGLPTALIAAGGDPAATVSQSSLHACAILTDPTERLGCYDQLAGHAPNSDAAPVAAAPSAATTAPAGAAAATAAAPATTTTATPAAPAPATATASGAPAAGTTAGSAAPATAAAAPPPKESFGLYTAEHPTAPSVAPSLDDRVVATGASASGRMTVTLASGALWELDDVDPLLAVGDVVSIRRAALGSFLLETPTKRTHRARRLR